jgi:hypothetical protein
MLFGMQKQAKPEKNPDSDSGLRCHQETIMTKLFMDNLALFIPMTLAGLLLVSEVHCGTRLVKTSVRTCGAIVGLLTALLVVEILPLLI